MKIVDHDKVMAGDNLDNIMCRLTYCCGLLDMIHTAATQTGNPMADVMGAAYDILRGIYADLDADVSTAEDYPEKDVSV